MAAVFEARPASNPATAAPGRPHSISSYATYESVDKTETVITTSRIAESVNEDAELDDDNNNNDDSLILAIRALRILENPRAAAAEAIQAFDPKAKLHPDLVRLLVAAAVRHPDVAQGLMELGAGAHGGANHHNHHHHYHRQMVQQHRSSSPSSRRGSGSRSGAAALHEISIASLLASIDEARDAPLQTNGGSTDGQTPPAPKPTLKRRLSVLSTKKAAAEAAAAAAAPAPPRKERITLDHIKNICKANLKDTSEAIERLERADLEAADDDDGSTAAAPQLRRMAAESLGHETGKFALCLALTLRDGRQRWAATAFLMGAMLDKLRLLLAAKGRFSPAAAGDVGLPGQDGFGVRDCWLVLSPAERERLVLDDAGAWPARLREVLQLAPGAAAMAWEILHACDRMREALAPPESTSSRRSSGEQSVALSSSLSASSMSDEGGAEDTKVVRHNQAAAAAAAAAASPQQITDRWAFFFDLLDEEAARRCFRELRLLRQLFNVAQAPGSGSGGGSSSSSNGNRTANLQSRARKAFQMGGRQDDDDTERWLDTKWAINAMRGFMLSKAGIYDDEDGDDDDEASCERLDKLDNAFCKVFWGCLGPGDHRRLAREDGKQWILDIMTVFEQRRRHEAMFRLRDILHFMQANVQ